jgi:hypothetical protein
MRFSDRYDITKRTDKDDWFDPVVTEDTPLYVDPFLVFEDSDESWSRCHEQVVDFFTLALS